MTLTKSFIVSIVAVVFVVVPFMAPEAEAATSYSYSAYSYSSPYSWMNTLVTKSQVTTTTLVCPKGEYVLKNAWGEFLCAPYDIRFSYNYGKVYYPYTKVTYTNTGSFTLGYR